MKRLSLILFVLLAQLAFSQKYPIHYKIVYNLENNHDVSQRTYYVTIHQAKLKKDKTNELEMHIVGLEDYDPHGKTFRYSSFKLNEANEYLRSSTNFFNLLSHYFPLQFSIAEEGILIDSAGFFEKLLDKSEEFAFQEQMTRDTKFLFLNDYKNLLNDIYFVDFSALHPDQLKQSEFQRSGFTYKIKERKKNAWLIEKSKSDQDQIVSEIKFHPKTKLILSKTSKTVGSSSLDGKPFNYSRHTIVSRQGKSPIIKVTPEYCEMLIKGSYWSRYFQFQQEVDSLSFKQYISDYGEKYGANPNYIKTILAAYQAMDDYEAYERELSEIPSELLVNSHHLINKVRIDDLSKENFLETSALLSDDQLYDYLQIDLSQGVKSNRQQALDRMHSLFGDLTEREKRAVQPMIIWSTYKGSSDNGDIQSGIDQMFDLDDQDWNYGNVGRYLILMIQRQFSNGQTDVEDYQRLRERLQVLADDKVSDKDLINKAHLAFVNYSIFKALKENKPEESQRYLKHAYELSAKGASDYDHHSYYDQFFIGSKKDYTEDYLADLGNRSGKEVALQEYIAEFASAPGRNYPMLKKFYYENYDQAGFSNFLKSAVFPKLQNAPAFLLKDLDGKEIDLSQFEGKWTLVDFWGTWCGPCVAELPEFNSLYEAKYSLMGDKLKILTISCYDRETDLRNFISTNKYTFPVLLSDGKVQQDYKVAGYPYKVLITPESKLIPIDFGLDWKGLLEEFVSL